jgi:molecular chaperone DnaJ
MRKYMALLMIMVFLGSLAAATAQPAVITEQRRGSEEISEYYNVNDVRLAMVIIAVAVIALFLYLARDVILRKKTDYERVDLESKKNRDYEKYHSEWNADGEDFLGGKKKTKESEEFRKMLQESRLPDYYSMLRVPSDATKREIKESFRRLVKEYHPDKTRDEKTAEKLAEINKAYEILSDDEKRKTYDRYFRASAG